MDVGSRSRLGRRRRGPPRCSVARDPAAPRRPVSVERASGRRSADRHRTVGTEPGPARRAGTTPAWEWSHNHLHVQAGPGWIRGLAMRTPLSAWVCCMASQGARIFSVCASPRVADDGRSCPLHRVVRCRDSCRHDDLRGCCQLDRGSQRARPAGLRAMMSAAALLAIVTGGFWLTESLR